MRLYYTKLILIIIFIIVYNIIYIITYIVESAFYKPLGMLTSYGQTNI